MRYIDTTIGAAPSLLQLRVGFPESVVFMYSRQPLTVESLGPSAGNLPVSLTVTHVASGRHHTETRWFYRERVEFDLSRIMQLLAPDVDSILSRVDYNEGKTLAEVFTWRLGYKDTDGALYNIRYYPQTDTITAMYGALDQTEIYGEHTQRRLWVNFPQTIALWRNRYNEIAFVTEDAYHMPDIAPGQDVTIGDVYPNITLPPAVMECDLIGTLEAEGDTELLAKLRKGMALRDLGLTWRARVENGSATEQAYRLVTLIPDCSTRGTYLRWLNRRGEVSYWLFVRSQLRTTTTVRESFVRYYPGDPAAPESDSIYTNSRKADYREAREMVLGAVGLSRDEYEDLCDLATSPVVERLVPEIPEEDTELNVAYDGGDSTTTASTAIEAADGAEAQVEGGDATTNVRGSGPYRWQRVTVAAGTFTRNIRRDTPNRQDLEFVIELPERNTVKL